MSTQISPLTSTSAVGRKTKLLLSYDRHREPLLDGLSANLTLRDYGRVARHPDMIDARLDEVFGK